MLKQSKKSIPELSPDHSALCLQTDMAGIILSASADLISFTGKHHSTLIGSSFKKIIDSPDKPKLQALLNTGVDTGLPIQLALKGKSGIQHIGFTARFHKSKDKAKNDVIEWNAVPEPATSSLAERQLEEIKAELLATRRELKEVTDRYKAFVQQSSEIIWRCELYTPIPIDEPEEQQLIQLFEGNLAECNDQMAHFYGYENTAGVIGKKISVFFDPNEPVTRQLVKEFIQQGEHVGKEAAAKIEVFFEFVIEIVERQVGMAVRAEELVHRAPKTTIQFTRQIHAEGHKKYMPRHLQRCNEPDHRGVSIPEGGREKAAHRTCPKCRACAWR